VQLDKNTTTPYDVDMSRRSPSPDPVWPGRRGHAGPATPVGSPGGHACRNGAAPRVPLSRERVLRAAVKVADEGGIASLTCAACRGGRGRGDVALLHVANKDVVLDGIVEVIADEINEVVDRIDIRRPATAGSGPCARGSCPPAR